MASKKPFQEDTLKMKSLWYKELVMEPFSKSHNTFISKLL